MRSIYFHTALSVVLASAALTACQDYDAGFDPQTIKQKEFAKQFEKVFGEIDPEQDWNMAQQITATLDLPISSTAVVVRTFSVIPISFRKKSSGWHIQGVSRWCLYSLLIPTITINNKQNSVGSREEKYNYI